MKTRRARVVRRLGIIAAAAVVVGGYFTGFAFAADDPSGSDSGSGSGSSLVKPLEEVVPNAALPDVDPGDITNTLSSVVSTLTSVIPTGLPGTSTASGPSGSNTVVIYSPYPFPVYGDFGNRYYGKYRDSGCGCDRYAAPTYKAPNYVAATQVSSVPKGGVDTGDGSFQ